MQDDDAAVRFLTKELTDPIVDLNPASFFRSYFRWAIERGRLNIVKLLMADPRANPAADMNEPMRYAMFYGYHEIVKALLTDPRVDTRIALCTAYGDKTIEAVVADHGVFVARHASSAWNAVAACACVF